MSFMRQFIFIGAFLACGFFFTGGERSVSCAAEECRRAVAGPEAASEIAELWRDTQRLTLDFTGPVPWSTQNADTVLEFLNAAFPGEDFRVNAPAELAVAVGNVPVLNWNAGDADALRKTWEARWTPAHASQFSLRFGYPLEPFLSALFDGEAALDAVSAETLTRVRNDVNRLLLELYSEKFIAPLEAWCLAREARLRFCFAADTPDTPVNRVAEMEAARGCNEMGAFSADAQPYARSVARVEGRPYFYRHMARVPLMPDTRPPSAVAVVTERDTAVYETLQKNGVPCDFISPRMLAEGTVTRVLVPEPETKTDAAAESVNIILGFGPAEYRTLILHEDVTALTPEAAAFLARFARQGGELLIFCTSEEACAAEPLPAHTGSLYRVPRRDEEVRACMAELRARENPPRWVCEISLKKRENPH